MQHKRGKEQKLVTYGKSTKNRSKTNPTDSSSDIKLPASATIDKQERLGVPRKSHVTQLQEKRQAQHQQRGSRSLVDTKATDAQADIALEEACDQAVFDPPSCDERETYETSKSKRRKLAYDGQKQSRRDITNDGGDSASESRTNTKTFKIANITPTRPYGSSLEPGRRISGQNQYHAQVSPRAHGNSRTAIETSPSAKQRTSARKASRQDKSPSPESEVRVMATLEFSPGTSRGIEKATPPRRRLVDSLDILQRSPAPAIDDEPKCEQEAGQRTQSKPISSNDTSYGRNVKQVSAPVPVDSRGSKVTYARQRSFIDDISLADAAKGQDASAFSADQRHPIQSQPIPAPAPRILHTDNDEDIDSGPVRSIHELRQAGDNARFRSEIDLALEEIEDPQNSVSGRCNGLIQLCTKLLDFRFTRRFSEYGFDKRFVESITHDLDIVSASFALYAYEIIGSTHPLPYTVLDAFWPKLLDFSPRLLTSKDELQLLVSREKALSKAVKASAKSVLPQLSLMICGEEGAFKITPRFLAIRCIQSTLRNIRKGDNITPIPVSLLSSLIELVTTQSDSEAATVSSSPEGFPTLIAILSLLESYTVLPHAMTHGYCEQFEPLSCLHRFLDASWYSFNGQSRQAMALYIRVILNLTNNGPSLCNVFSTSDLVGGLVKIITKESCDEPEDSPTKENSSLNTVILALGVLINLTEKSDLSREVFVNRTDNSPTFLQLLLQKFFASIGTVPQAHSVPEVHHNVVIGYLSTLLITLSLNMKARSQVKGFSNGRGLVVVLSINSEFLQYHQKVEQDLHPSEPEDSKISGFVTRIRDIICQIKEQEML